MLYQFNLMPFYLVLCHYTALYAQRFLSISNIRFWRGNEKPVFFLTNMNHYLFSSSLLGRLGIFYGNKTTVPLTNFNVGLHNNPDVSQSMFFVFFFRKISLLLFLSKSKRMSEFRVALASLKCCRLKVWDCPKFEIIYSYLSQSLPSLPWNYRSRVESL